MMNYDGNIIITIINFYSRIMEEEDKNPIRVKQFDSPSISCEEQMRI